TGSERGLVSASSVILPAVGAILVGVAFVLGCALCGLARWLAPRVGLVDRPGGRKAQRRVTPLGGGVAIWLTTGLVLATGAAVVEGWGRDLPYELGQHVGGLRERAVEMAGIFGLATLIMAMGLVDDKVG